MLPVDQQMAIDLATMWHREALAQAFADARARLLPEPEPACDPARNAEWLRQQMYPYSMQNPGNWPCGRVPGGLDALWGLSACACDHWAPWP